MPRRRRTLSPETIKVDVGEVKQAINEKRRKHAALVVLQGSESDIGSHVLLDNPVIIGRDPAVELPLQDQGISRRHCRIRAEADGFVIEDLGSTNGTLLNGERLKAPRALHPGDRIFLGSCVVKFAHADELEVGYHAQMDNLISTDDLTGLVAKRRFDAAFERALEAARNSQSRLAVLMLDLDSLKQINDAHGHPVGAYTISQVGRIIGAIVSPQGAACRVGGDEFAAILPGLSRRAARGIGEAIRSRVAEHPVQKDDLVLHTTISVGIAIFPEDGDTPDVLLHKADQALYRAKRTGRDRVES
jgi:diguanylate cyclase (GGDEF)-like protein